MFNIIAIQTLPVPHERYITPDDAQREERFEIDLRRARFASVMKVLKEDKWYWLRQIIIAKIYVYLGNMIKSMNSREKQAL